MFRHCTNIDYSNCGKRRCFTERVPLSYACYFSYSLISTTTEIHFLPTFTNRKRCNLKKITMLLSSNFILSCVGAFIALCFDFLNLFCSSGNYSGSLVADFEQAIKPSALREFVCFLIRKKRMCLPKYLKE